MTPNRLQALFHNGPNKPPTPANIWLFLRSYHDSKISNGCRGAMETLRAYRFEALLRGRLKVKKVTAKNVSSVCVSSSGSLNIIPSAVSLREQSFHQKPNKITVILGFIIASRYTSASLCVCGQIVCGVWPSSARPAILGYVGRKLF